MREYKINIEEHERNWTSSAGEPTTELGLLLQVYQDLKRIDSELEEDVLVMSVLSQILETHFGAAENIPVPAEYQKGNESYYEEE